MLIFTAPICALHGFLSCLYSSGERLAFVLLCLKFCCRLTCSNCSGAFFSSPAVLCFLVSALGITAGSHRLWSHRSYRATLPLRIFLTIANSIAFQVSTSSVCHWSSEGSAPLNPCLRYGAQADGEVPLSYYLLLGNNLPFPPNPVVLQSVSSSSPSPEGDSEINTVGRGLLAKTKGRKALQNRNVPFPQGVASLCLLQIHVKALRALLVFGLPHRPLAAQMIRGETSVQPREPGCGIC